ncbi:MAG: response regulator [Thermodesulfobacteriota bacterium]|nr:response regulator [Thermodesulfobacteriota bacterium]
MRILVTDDELVSRKKLQKILSSIGECEEVESGSDAITAFKKAWENKMPFDLITLDISMPEMGGIETLLKIRTAERGRGIPEENKVKIVMVTSAADKDTITSCIHAGCDDYILKPFDKKIIVNKLMVPVLLEE